MLNGEAFAREIDLFFAKKDADCSMCPARSGCPYTASSEVCICAKHFNSWTRKEYTGGTVERRSRQQWANSTGFFPEKDASGRVYLFLSVPVLGEEVWKSSSGSYIEITDFCIADDVPWTVFIHSEADRG